MSKRSGLAPWIRRASTGQLLLGLVAVFVCSRLAYSRVGISFDDSPIGYFWQYLDPQLLRDRLLESSFYLHSQPPLFNLFLGLGLKLPSEFSRWFFRGSYLAAGLILCLSLFLLQVRLGVSKAVGFILTAVFVLSPPFLLYENWLFYTFPLAALLAVSSLLFLEALEKRSRLAVFSFFASLLLICATRSLFSWIYFIAMASMLVISCRRYRRRVLLAAVIPAILVFLIPFKNAVLFDSFSSSSWDGAVAPRDGLEPVTRTARAACG
jgi:hypothetical protein